MNPTTCVNAEKTGFKKLNLSLSLIAENSCSQAQDDPNKVSKAIPSNFIDLKLFGREFHTMRISFSELSTLSFVVPSIFSNVSHS